MSHDLTLQDALKQAFGPVLAADARAKVLLLSCIDLRYPHRIIETMDAMGHRGRYYHLAMAGASHAAVHDDAWARAFADHLAFAVEECQVRGVVILDHLSCKAYEVYERVPPGDLEAERARHLEVASRVVADVVTRFPSLAGNVKAFLLPVEAPSITPDPLAEG